MPLPDKITRIDVVRIARNREKLCKCRAPHYELDEENRIVTCLDCGAILDPFDTLCKIANKCERLYNQVDTMLEQARQIDNYKPHLKVVKNLEEHLRHQLYPCCPHCKNGIDLKEVNQYINYKYIKRSNEK